MSRPRRAGAQFLADQRGAFLPESPIEKAKQALGFRKFRVPLLDAQAGVSPSPAQGTGRKRIPGAPVPCPYDDLPPAA